jgi:hypothetical protein
MTSLDVMIYSLLTIVCRAIPPDFVQSHPLQCSDECVQAARMALSTFVKLGNNMLQLNPRRWTMLVNV